MSRFNRLSHVIWCCKYHIVWVPKYRFRILNGEIATEIYKTIYVYCGRMKCEVIELNVQNDHVHLVVSVPPKESISKLLGMVKGKTAIQIFRQFPYLKSKPYWGNHFWARGYCVDTVGIDEEIIRKYVKFQEKEESRQDGLQF
ncbi:MAG: IS200/IS605 family transposase [Gammaproteobacteria bacterium]|nr:MAG: IS200/IS605 family transposase [Gammaproteobacteria bacterium]PCJ46913.1 MAG: IS200/IS605 family transposase [Gammaproteobacteria bacterium]